jgi:hypothetical protein
VRSFYTALHLINAHLAKFELQYSKHVDVKNALNPERTQSISKLPEDEYVAYAVLQMLSRRSRYLVNEKDSQIGATSAFLTHDVHLAKSVKHLDCLVTFFRINTNFHCYQMSRFKKPIFKNFVIERKKMKTLNFA